MNQLVRFIKLFLDIDDRFPHGRPRDQQPRVTPEMHLFFRLLLVGIAVAFICYCFWQDRIPHGSWLIDPKTGAVSYYP